MALSMFQASIPVFTRALDNLSAVLDKGAKHAQSLHVEPDRLLQQRLIFDMFNLVQQVQRACDTAARSAARMANVEPKAFPDNETTLAQVHARIQGTIDYLNSFKADQFEGTDTRNVTMKSRGNDLQFTGRDYLFNYALPNLFFHCTAAYAILRVAGAQVGKLDYLGAL